CALTCIANADSGGCSATDNVCLCESKEFIGDVESCIDNTCQGQDKEEAKQFVQDTCASVGVPYPGGGEA
ncbi:uncharacterized protein FOMMEDRAFT_87837, partial [Fomitiporia mediterranea MF3/22]|uniref:uncharacterized protein n=1 Tax=Fomitiporia mediterranea (strain MF3/22) TaxID=694068 RepID=UPI0004408184